MKLIKFTIPLILIFTTLVLKLLGRNWWCQEGDVLLGTFSPSSSHTSQHLIDPYSLSHLEHGFLFFALLYFFKNRLSTHALWIIAISLESFWEILENTNLIIDRYRAATISLDYFGDSIANSLSDILFCAIGFAIALRLPLKVNLFIILLIEIISTYWIRDGVFLNLLMLLYPISEVKDWQMGG